MNAGPHVVSLSAHGNSGGCCGAGNAMASGLTNGWHTFIVYADSCLTNQVDASDAFSEELLKNSMGGAVACVGIRASAGSEPETTCSARSSID